MKKRAEVIRRRESGSLIKGQTGFTLIELMITVVVVVLALVGYVGANTAIQQKGETGYERNVAIQDANRVIEQMRTASENGQFPGNVTSAFPDNGTVEGFNNLAGETITVSYDDPSAIPLTATVTVNWLENGRRAGTTALRTILAQRNTA